MTTAQLWRQLHSFLKNLWRPSYMHHKWFAHYNYFKNVFGCRCRIHTENTQQTGGKRYSAKGRQRNPESSFKDWMCRFSIVSCECRNIWKWYLSLISRLQRSQGVAHLVTFAHLYCGSVKTKQIFWDCEEWWDFHMERKAKNSLANIRINLHNQLFDMISG